MGEAAPEYPFEQATASKFASILGPPAQTSPAESPPRPEPSREAGKPSAVHIPAELEPRIRAFQRHHGGARALSNGKLLVWALADCHARRRLDDLVGARNVGGDVFGAWTVTATPDHEGPTFPFTVYLPASFYDTFDELVARHGAKSRSQLAALAITDFLKQRDAEGTG